MKKILILFILVLYTGCTILKIYTCENVETTETTEHTYILQKTIDTIPDSTTLVIDNQQIIITNNNEKYTITGLKIK